MDVARHDADLAPAAAGLGAGVRVGGSLARAGLRPRRDDARAVGADERDELLGRADVGAPSREVDLVQHRADAHHVRHRHALGDGADHADARLHGLEDGVGAERRRHENHGGLGAGLANGLVHAVEDGQAGVGIDLEGLATLARRDAPTICVP